MTTRVQHRRFTVAGALPPAAMPAGELAVNLQDLQLFTSRGAGAALALLAVQSFVDTAKYAIGAMVTQGGVLYTCKTANGPGAFNAAHWNNTGDLNTQGFIDAAVAAHEAKANPHTVYLLKAGGTITGALTVSGALVASGGLTAPAGSLAAPGMIFANDADTGFFSPAPGVVAVVTNGIERMRWDAGGSISNVVPPGAMVDFGGPVPPAGWLLCDGTVVSRTTYPALFAAIGTTWGAGDGAATFALPDMRRRVAIGSGGTAASGPAATVGAVGGAETTTLTVANMPSHTHGVSDGGHNHPVGDPGHGHNLSNFAAARLSIHDVMGYWAGQGGEGPGPASVAASASYTGVVVYGATSNIAVQAAGSGAAVGMFQPSVTVTKIIKV